MPLLPNLQLLILDPDILHVLLMAVEVKQILPHFLGPTLGVEALHVLQTLHQSTTEPASFQRGIQPAAAFLSASPLLLATIPSSTLPVHLFQSEGVDFLNQFGRWRNMDLKRRSRFRRAMSRQRCLGFEKGRGCYCCVITRLVFVILVSLTWKRMTRVQKDGEFYIKHGSVDSMGIPRSMIDRKGMAMPLLFDFESTKEID
jgi:hypothetical protein